jgi:uncharacterized protein
MKPIFPDRGKLAEVFKKYPDIQAVYLFGSTAGGKIHSESDIDLGILPKNSSLRNQKLELLADLTRQGFDNLDVVLLDTSDIVIKFEVVRQNHLIYVAKEFNASDFFSLTVRQYFDFMPYLNIQREAYKKRILQNG